jgi:predicted ribonuclease YlaK
MPKTSKRMRKGPQQSARVLPFILDTQKRKTTEGGLMGKRAAAAIPISKGFTLDDLQLFTPLTKNQERAFDLYDQGNTAIMLHGVPGTGKTFIALYKGLEEVLDRKTPYRKLVVVRSCVAGRDVGFLPGTIEEKAAIYQRPYIDMCATLFRQRDAWDKLLEQGAVEFLTTSFNRGITLDHAVVVVDEAQNLGFQEISTIMSRVGTNTKIIFSGDFRQTDLGKKGDASGLTRFIEITRMMPSFRSVEFEVDDIVRSDLCKEWIVASLAYEDATKQKF